MKKTIHVTLVLILVSLTAFQHNSHQKEPLKELGKGYIYVPTGSTFINGKITSIQSFCMLKSEVSNWEYTLFLNDLKANNAIDKLKIATLDTSNWDNEFNSKNTGMSRLYSTHPAYREYPVVNVSHEAAELYCAWATEKVNQRLGVKNKYLFRLPMEAEFIYAAEGGNSGQHYAWKGAEMRNTKGQALCNFASMVDQKKEDFNEKYDGQDLMAPVISFFPNAYGLNNMNGNVAEMLNTHGKAIGGSWKDKAEDVRNYSVAPYTQSKTNIGFRIVTTVLN
jgi:formylglycine-generating enzyme required for sulfatase activity